MSKKSTKKMSKKGTAGLLTGFLIFLMLLFTNQLKDKDNNKDSQNKNISQKIKVSNYQALEKIRKNQKIKDASFWTEIDATVLKILPDDTHGSKHQRFLIKLSADITLLVAHNIDLAQRIPLQKGELLTIRGKYEWNEKGGVIHWTHHNPRGGKGGWIKYHNKIYK